VQVSINEQKDENEIKKAIAQIKDDLSDDIENIIGS
jgi:hypothetical protein